jgi:hypothetical protein
MRISLRWASRPAVAIGLVMFSVPLTAAVPAAATPASPPARAEAIAAAAVIPATRDTVAPANHPTATIIRPLYLAGSGGQANNPNWNPESIQLAQGWYTFGYTLSLGGPSPLTAQDSRQIFLDAGTYLWQCNIDGETEGSFPGINYDTYCSLERIPESNAFPTAFLPVVGGCPGCPWNDHWALPPGNYTWTGYLTPEF